MSPDTEAEAERAVAILESLIGSAWVTDPDGKLTYVTSFSAPNLDLTLDQLNATVDKGETAWKPKTHPDDYEGLAVAWRHALNTGDPFLYENRCQVVNGYVWGRSAACPIRDRRGRITGWYGTSITTGVYRKDEEALRDRERELSQLVDMVRTIWGQTSPADHWAGWRL
jgi:PAS domain-containing protein